MASNRILYFDLCKALAIFLVILGDVAIFYNKEGLFSPLSTYVHSFHTALFMFISGFFFKNALKKSKQVFLENNIRHLLIPYITWSVVCLFLVQIPNEGLSNTIETIKHFILGGFMHEYWYIKCLLAYLVVTYFLIKILRSEHLGCVLSLFLFSFSPSVFYTGLFIPYFIAGYYSIIIIEKYSEWRWVGLLFLISAILYNFWKPEYNYNITREWSFVSYIVRTGIGCSNSLLIIMVIKKISTVGKFWNFWGNVGIYTLGIYCSREIFYRGFSSLFLKHLDFNDSLIFDIILSVFVLIVCYFICKWFDKCSLLSYLFLGNKRKGHIFNN